MKGIGRILLIIFAVLAIVGLVWVAITPNAAGSEIDATAWMSNPLTTYMIIVPLITLIISVVAFVIFKVVDLFKHPAHMKEAMWTAGTIVIALVLGFIFADSGEIANANGISYEGLQSKLMGTGIISAGILLAAGFMFLAYDTIKGIIKS